MCGLVGLAGNINKDQKTVFRDMFIFDAVRGLDSSGVVVVRSIEPKDEKQYIIEKDLGPPQNLWDWNVESVFDGRGNVKGWPKVLMGHNRAATIGKVTTNNAHPFEFDHIVGMHNGSLRNWRDLEDAKDFDVDSKALLNNIAKNGIDHTWKNFTGAAAITYWDDKEKRLNFIRNSERPLYLSTSKNEQVLFWASESWMIHAAAGRNNVELKKEDGKAVMVSLPVDTLWSYSVTGVGYKKQEERKLEKKEVPTPQIGYYTGNPSTEKVSEKNKSNRLSLSSAESALSEFKPDMNWKEGTEEFVHDYKSCFIFDPRWVQRAGFKGEVSKSNVFRFSMASGDKHLGILDVYPMNKKEFFKFLRVVDDIRKGDNFEFDLTDNPRAEKSSKYTAVPRFLCTPSVINFKKTAKVVDLIEKKHYLAPNGESVDKPTMQKLLKEAGDCCTYCQQSITVEEANKISWVDTKEPLCPECTVNWGGNLHMLMQGVVK